MSLVFDGCSSNLSTKDHEHVRRSAKTAATVVLALDAVAYTDQQAFLANVQNKASFIELLSQKLCSVGHAVTQASSDADTSVVRVALQTVTTGQHTTVVADDTDILVLLVFHWQSCMAEVHMQKKARGKTKVASTTISIPLVQQLMGCETARRLLVIHALSGCDTTSAVFGHGKVSAFKKLSANCLGNLCDAVSSSDSSQSDVGHAGCQLLVALYGGTVRVESLDKLRYTTYMKLCSSSKAAITP